MDEYAKLAKDSLEHYIRTGKHMDMPTGLPKNMDEPSAVFVSLKKHGDLRGCIGSLEPTQPTVKEEILRYAVIAGTQDPRFNPVTEDELADITYSVDVLGKPEPVDSHEELDPKIYGVIVSNGMRHGVLLPDLEGIDTVEHQLQIALSKAGIRPGENFSAERFIVVRHK